MPALRRGGDHGNCGLLLGKSYITVRSLRPFQGTVIKLAP